MMSKTVNLNNRRSHEELSHKHYDTDSGRGRPLH